MPKAKIICTLGPACDSRETLARMIEAGMSVARLNFSHGDHATHAQRARWVRSVSRRMGVPVAILQDLQGPKIRLGQFEGGQLEVKRGQSVVLTNRRGVMGHGKIIPAPVTSLPKDVRPGDPILLDDGRVRLTVVRVRGDDVEAHVEQGGVLKDRKGLNLPGAPMSVRTLTPKDRVDLAFGQKLGVDWVALSFVRSARDIENARALVKHGTPLIAKIEKPQAVVALDEIAVASDAVMVARGDLGVEVPLETLPTIQKRAVERVNVLGKICVVATEMLESMTDRPRPTRAEVSDVANAILDGADAVMLSGETAAGKFPVEAVDTMRRIVEEAEAHGQTRHFTPFAGSPEVTTGVAAAAVAAATQLGVDTIVAYTESGYTAQLISKFRPRARILALTPNAEVVHRLQLVWGVEAQKVGRHQTTDAMVAQVRRICLQDKRCVPGKPVIIVAGVPLNQPGNTNLMTVHTL